MSETTSNSVIQLFGAGAFGMIVGWYVYFINRYRTGNVQFKDLTTLVGIIGGGALLALFEAGTDLFGAYGLGLAAGFFGYFIVLLIMVRMSDNFKVDWFLDGRRKSASTGEVIPPGTAETVRPMGGKPEPGSGPKEG